MSFVRVFAEIGIGDRLSVGGKGANLGELTRAGIAPPPGFVVTTAAFERFLDATGARDAIRRALAELRADDLAAIEAAGKTIRDGIEAADFPEDIEARDPCRP